LFDTLSASLANSDASSATENATRFGLPSSPLALLTTAMIGASLSHSMYVYFDWMAPSSRFTASKSPNIVRERFTTASSEGRLGSSRAVAAPRSCRCPS
jgi:hypothetical protein